MRVVVVEEYLVMVRLLAGPLVEAEALAVVLVLLVLKVEQMEQIILAAVAEVLVEALQFQVMAVKAS
jgi:hypothetical protein